MAGPEEASLSDDQTRITQTNMPDIVITDTQTNMTDIVMLSEP